LRNGRGIGLSGRVCIAGTVGAIEKRGEDDECGADHAEDERNAGGIFERLAEAGGFGRG